jgi:curli biogenesis system outer membrane secretion channel CsgG
MVRRICSAATLLLFAAVFGANLLEAQEKKRVAIFAFDYATVHSNVSAIFGTNVDVGKGISDLLVEKLLAGGKYSIIERQDLDKILTEQNFSNSNRADPGTASQIGRILGVDAIIIGSITQFGRDDKSTSVGGGAIGGITGRFGVGGVRRSESKAVVALTARLVNTSTGEILAAMTGNGESSRSGTGLLGAGGSWAGAAAGAIDMSNKNFANTILGEAVHQAVGSLAARIDQNASSMPAREVNVEGLVADVAGNVLILNVGSSAGLRIGDKLSVNQKVREVKDPATGKVLRSIVNKVGDVVITEVDPSSAVGTFTGSGTPKVGDEVKSQ